MAPKAGCFCEPELDPASDELPPPPVVGVDGVWTGSVSVGSGVVSVGAEAAVVDSTDPVVDELS